jgi:undecaprenyl-phosphate 4-deoxy-4-formamido-L-arabinose transferase
MTEIAPPEVSIVIPTYRGFHRLKELLPSVERSVQSFTHEIVLVDDGSDPLEQKRIRELARSRRTTVVVCLDRNTGQQHAGFVGLAAARGAVVVTLDDDGDHPPELIPRLVNKIDDRFDLVYGVPRQRSRPVVRRIGTSLNNALFSRFLGKPADVPVTSFRAIDRRLLARALATPVSWPYLSAMLFSCGARARAVPYSAPVPETDRASRYTVGQLAALFFRLLLFWGPLRAIGRAIRPPRPVEIRGGCRE